MDSIGELVQSAQGLLIGEYLLVGGVVLTLYDFLLMFGEEVQYIWGGRKSWIFYLYISNRILLTVLQLWNIYGLSSTSHSKTFCLWRYYISVIVGPLFMLSSEIFVMLRIYAITFRNKILAVYFGSMTLARFIVSLASVLIKPPVVLEFPPIPIDAFETCGFILRFQFRTVPHSLGTAFEISAFLVIIWCAYRTRGMLRFSALVRTIVTEATIYFLAMVTAQTCIQLSFSLMGVVGQQLFYIAYGIATPILTVRFAVSLKQSADPKGGEEWGLKHFSSVKFAGGHSIDVQVPDASQDIEMDHFDRLNDQVQSAKITDR